MGTVITPCAFDQFDNANLVASSGVGVAMRQFSKVTAQALAAALVKCTTDEAMVQKSKAMGEKMQAEDGLGNAVKAVDAFIQDEVMTGNWKSKLEKRKLDCKRLRAQGPPSCFAWIGRLCCSGAPN